MGVTKKAFANYVDRADDLAENVKRNIAHEGIIDNKTVLALNEFIIAVNAIKDLTDEIKSANIKLN